MAPLVSAAEAFGLLSSASLGVLMVVFLPFPVFLPTTADTMKHAGPILGPVVLMALVDWIVGGRHRFQVPTSKTEDI